MLFSRDAFCLFYNAQTKNVQALNGSGHSPEKLTMDYVRQRGIDGLEIPHTDLNSVTVPGQLVHPNRLGHHYLQNAHE